MSFGDCEVKHIMIVTKWLLIHKTPPPRLQSSVEFLRENLYSLSPQSMGSQLEALVERTEDFTDSAYTSHEQRQAILGLCQLARQDTQQLVHAWVEAVRWHSQSLCICAQMPTGRFKKSMCNHLNNNKDLICKTCKKESFIEG